MLKAFKYELFPSEEQKSLIEKHFGCSRFIYNWGLELKIKSHSDGKSISCIDIANQLPKLKEENQWLKEVNSQSLQMSLRSLDNAFTSFFEKRTDFPKFKARHKSKPRFQCPQHVRVDFETKTVVLPKIKEIPFALDRKFDGAIKTTTVSRTPTNRYFVSILVDDGKELPAKPKVDPKETIGIDLGIKDFCITSDGEKTGNPSFLRKEEKRLGHHQRRLSKKKKGGIGYKRQKLVVAKIHERIANRRKDFLHKTSTMLIRENQSICIEDLAVGNMLKNHCLAKSISDVAWGEFRRMLDYKADWQGKNLLTIGRFESSSKTCSKCGYVNRELTLSDREWICPVCRIKHDRDVNAAKNIKAFALTTHDRELHLKELGQSLNKAVRRDVGTKRRPKMDRKPTRL